MHVHLLAEPIGFRNTECWQTEIVHSYSAFLFVGCSIGIYSTNCDTIAIHSTNSLHDATIRTHNGLTQHCSVRMAVDFRQHLCQPQRSNRSQERRDWFDELNRHQHRITQLCTGLVTTHARLSTTYNLQTEVRLQPLRTFLSNRTCREWWELSIRAHCAINIIPPMDSNARNYSPTWNAADIWKCFVTCKNAWILVWIELKANKLVFNSKFEKFFLQLK